MAFLDFLNPFFNFIFGWLLPLPPFWSIMMLSALMSLIVIVITKLTTDQNLMKHLKNESKELQKQMKELKDNPEKMMEVQKKHMDSSMKYMTQSFRPMLFTFIPIILIFGWISGHLAYDPIMPGQEFSVQVTLEKNVQGVINATAPDGIELTGPASQEVTTGPAIFTFKADTPGTYSSPGLVFTVNGKSYEKEIIIANERHYAAPLLQVRDGTVSSIQTMQNKLKVIQIGSFGITWIWSYIIFSIFFSSVLRKWMKVY